MSAHPHHLGKLAVFGASGRMGRAVLRLASHYGLDVVFALAKDDAGRDAGELAGHGKTGIVVTEDVGLLVESGAKVAIDFSHPAALPGIVSACRAAKVALVSGTTGIDDETRGLLAEASREIPVLWEPNMSVGIFVLSAVVKQAVTMLGLDFDVEVVEAHHHHKADAPSGTALRLAEVAVAARRGLGSESRLVHGREGKSSTRAADEIGMHAMRGGDVIGDHTVHLLGGGERLELTHKASSRDLFAKGALRSAAWILHKEPGRYALADVLG